MVKQLRFLRYTIETILVNALVFSTLYQLVVYLANRRFWRQPSPPPVETVPSISVVVPLHGKSPDTLAQLHLLAITRPTDQYDVTLVLESDQDLAYPAAQAVARSYPQIVRVVTSGPAGSHAVEMHALNAGYQAAHGDLVAFVEAHVQLSVELWNAALAVLADPDIGAAYAPPLVREPEHRGSSRVPTGGEMLTALYTNHAQTAELPFAALGNRVQELSSGFMIVRRRVLQDMGGLLYLLDQAAADISLGRAVREIGYRLAAIPVPARVLPEPETFNEATHHLQRVLMVRRACRPAAYLAQPFTNPLTVGFLLGFITEREGRRWGRRTWWVFVWLRMAIAYELDRVRFGRGFTWIAYAQLFMLDTFIAPVLWARALFQRTFTWHGRTYRIAQGGRVSPAEDS
ncbi:MAG TPA: glycosyltransferase family 2 protein [Aggregatilineaceae bacterium]|jgi:cellulose synthase/poly-beta-1,6-N-acetylglucosamine synthase-like glycosyltransferase|nr:glycosyltransferase family 2 protein [Aggregatilineaceae bacterium]